jgi:S-adenosylmethionine synthetase
VTDIGRLATSLSAGHVDKLADQISDAVLDAVLEQDPLGRVACEALVANGGVVLAGEITTTAQVDLSKIARHTLRQAGYDSLATGLDADSCAILLAIDHQSAEIAHGAQQSYEYRATASADQLDRLGAGDQGIVYGYASNENRGMIPLPVWLGHRITETLDDARRTDSLALSPPFRVFVSPCGSDNSLHACEVTVFGHTPEPTTSGEVRDKVSAAINEIATRLAIGIREPEVRLDVPLRALGHPQHSSGATGRRLSHDTYGEAVCHGGGGLSGKDATKTDRSGAYAARWVAKHIVASGAADRCRIDIAYAASVANPVAINTEFFGTEHIASRQIMSAIDEVFDLRPAAIISELDLNSVAYLPTATYGHFGRDQLQFPWEDCAKLDEFQGLLGNRDSGQTERTAGDYSPKQEEAL